MAGVRFVGMVLPVKISLPSMVKICIGVSGVSSMLSSDAGVLSMIVTAGMSGRISIVQFSGMRILCPRERVASEVGMFIGIVSPGCIDDA